VGRTTANGATAALVSGVVGPGGNGEGKVVRNGEAGGPRSNRVGKVVQPAGKLVQAGKVRARLGGRRSGPVRGEVREEATRKRAVVRAEMGKSTDVASGRRYPLAGWQRWSSQPFWQVGPGRASLWLCATMARARQGPLRDRCQGLNVGAIAKRVEPATVDISANGPDGQDEGTGMVLTPSGIVLTNNHVIDGSTVVTAQVDGTGKSYPVTVLGTDATDDVALLKLNGGDFRTVTIGNSSAITVGDQVVAVGNALALSGSETVTNGIISATDRSVSVEDQSTGLTENLEGLFQTSAPINPGNSGGPLVDSAGQVIGINTAEASSTGSGEPASNVGFAIPINKAMDIARQIQAGKASATVDIGTHPVMGVEVTTVACAEGQDDCTPLGSASPSGTTPFIGQPSSGYTAPVGKGAVVSEVLQGFPAQAAGLAVGDVITSCNGAAITSPSDLVAHLSHLKVGSKVTVGWVTDNGSQGSATVTLAASPNL